MRAGVERLDFQHKSVSMIKNLAYDKFSSLSLSSFTCFKTRGSQVKEAKEKANMLGIFWLFALLLQRKDGSTSI